MRKSFLLMSLFLSWSTFAMAQNWPFVELLGEYSNYWVNDTHAHGLDAFGTVNIDRWLGIDADFSGHCFPETITFTAQSTTKANLRQYRSVFNHRQMELAYNSTEFGSCPGSVHKTMV